MQCAISFAFLDELFPSLISIFNDFDVDDSKLDPKEEPNDPKIV
jgi:hypothetical protein